MRYAFYMIVLSAFLSIVPGAAVYAQNAMGPANSMSSGAAHDQGAAGIPQKQDEIGTQNSAGSTKDVTVDRDPAPRMPPVDKP
jgi:hypothetical protein